MPEPVAPAIRAAAERAGVSEQQARTSLRCSKCGRFGARLVVVERVPAYQEAELCPKCEIACGGTGWAGR